MATTETEIRRMWREIDLLKQQVTQLRRKDSGRRTAVRRKPIAPRPRKRAGDKLARLDEALRRAGLLAELTPEEKAMAAEWRALPEEEKARTREELWNLKLSQPLSQIIIENR
jgi:hypothetical protein